ITNGVFDKVADRLGDQLAMTEQLRRLLGAMESKHSPSLFGHGFVHFAELRPERADVEAAELAAAGERLGSADLQRGREDPHQRVRLANDAGELLVALGRIAGLGSSMR